MKTDRKIMVEKSPPKVKAVKRNSRAGPRTNGKHPLAVYEHIPVGIVETSLDGKYMDVNEEFCRILGYSRRELLRRGIKDCTYEDDYTIDYRLYEQLTVGKIPFYRIEKRYVRKDGGIIWVELTRSLVCDAKGKPLYTVGVVLDISDRKDVERVLRDSVERLRLATGAAHMFMWEWDFQTQSYTIADNFEQVLGFSAGLLPKNKFETVWALSPGEDVQRLSESFEKAVENQSDLHALACRVINPENGQIVWLEISAKIVYDSEGNPERIFGVAQNITESKRMEDAVRESEERFRALVSQTTAGIIECDMDGRLTFVNPRISEMLGYPEEELIGKTIWELTYPDDIEENQRLFKRMLTHGASYQLEKRFIRRDGSILWTDVSVSTIRDLAGNSKGGVGVVLDIEKRKQAEAGLTEFALQQEALYNLADQLHRTTSLQDVYNAALDAILSALQGDRASILLFDHKDVMRFVAWRGLSDAYRTATDGHSPWKPDTKDPQPVVMDDIRTAELTDALRAVIHEEGIGSLAFIPLVSNGKLIGKFMIYYDAPHTFDEAELDLSLTIAHQLAFGIDRKRAEDALARERETLERLFETMPVMVSMIHPESNSMRLNAEFERRIGWKSEEVSVLSLLEALYPDPEYRQSVLQRMAEAGKNEWVEVQVQTRDGRTMDSIWSNISIMEDQKLVMGIAIGLDMTERKQTEKRLTLLAEISDMLRNVDDQYELMYMISEAVGQHLGVKRALFNEIDLEHDREIVHRDYHNGVDSVAGIHKVSDYSSATSAEVAAGKTVVNSDSKTDPRTAPDYEPTYAISGERAYVVVPLMRDNRWVASLWVSDDAPRQWSNEEVSLLETVAERTWAIVEKLRINTALRESEERYRFIVENTSDGIWWVELTEPMPISLSEEEQIDWYYQHAVMRQCNLGLARMYGYDSIEDVVGLPMRLLMPRENPVNLELSRQFVRSGYRLVDAESHEVNQDGRELVFLNNMVGIVEDGRLVGEWGTNRDITERKRAEEALHESERRFREMIDALPVAIYTTDAEGRLTHFNPAAVEFSGRTPEIGTDQWCVTWKLYYPDGSPMPHDECPMAITLREGRVVRGVEAIAERPDGKRIWFEPFPTPLRDSEGRVVGGINMLVDITERKRAEETLRASEALYRTIARSIPGGGVYVVDKDFRYLVAEGPVTEAFGLSREILEGHTVMEVFPDERGKRMEDRLRRNFAGESVDFETQLNKRYFWTQMALVHDSIGQAIILTLDITERKQAEEALRQSEERFARFMQHLPGLAWIKDLDGRYVYANAAAEKAFSTPREKLYGSTDEDIFPPEVAAQFRRNDVQALSEEKGVQVIETLKHDDGVLHSSLVSKFPIPGADGTTRLIGGTAFDITERLQAEEALLESEERFRAILRQATAGIVRKDGEGRFIFVNQAYCDMVGYAESELLGKTCWDVTHPDDIPENKWLYDRMMTKGIPFKMEKRLIRKDGSLLWVDISLSPIMDATGKPQTAVAVEVDITGRRQAEIALRESEERFRAILRQATAGIVRKDAQGRLLFVNEAFCNMLGYTELDLTGKTIWEFMHPDDVEENRRSYERLMLEGIPFKLERRFLRQDGSVIWVDASVSPIIDSIGKPQSAVAVEVDITGRKLAEESLRQLNLQLEDRVLSRTAKLRAVNQTLREEITERQRVEEALRQSEALARANEEKLSTLFELLPVGISFLGPEGQVIQVNPALTNMMKLSKEQLSDQTYRSRKYIRPNGTVMSPAEFASRRALTEGKTVYNVETGVILEDDEVLWTSVSAAPVNVAEVGAVVVTVDITESKRAERALKESRERLQILSQRLVEVQEEERRAIARELHDRVGQTLAALNINLIIISGQLGGKVDEQTSTRLNDSMKLVAETIALVRDVMSNLRPAVLDDYGLEAAIDSHLSQYTSRYEISVRFEKPGQPIPRLGPSIEMTFLRIAQEALMNIARHAQATQVHLALWQEDTTICMTIQDNGMGITSWQDANRPGSHGLTIMRERAEAFGGNLKVSSVPGKGTKVEVKIPVETSDPSQAQEGESQ